MPETERVEKPTTPIARDKRKYAIGGIASVGMLALFALAITNGEETEWSNSESNDTANPQNAEVPALETETEGTDEPVFEARGVIAAKQESTIASRLTARILSIPVGEGGSFRRGATLATFDCSMIRAQLTAARAATTAYRKTHETNVELDTYEAVGTNEVEVSEANLGQAIAEANAIRAQLNDCSVTAPFSGTVVEQIANRGEVAASGQPLLKIQSGNDLEAELIVPSNWLNWLRAGAEFDFVIDETGTAIPGAVTQLGASVDPVSKTIRVKADIDPGEALVLPGMSGTASFGMPDVQIDSANVSAGDDGSQSS
ncbi:efflux RND transporter periplasmic adaptor subunit [Erythrobacter rubeus]|uniref:Efflux RND transporter periplasmic adaptor subunit n=1 Tax=Erythrobacter rubeus TaxID=2760803 RepID=A0ABR8KNU1_9SPHN|nr:efflux RND transporter periplasmic adaptor subunit [Erythrobacter rubeus]MBD2840633.1 efflux RND transporter periplasmic adaptor subunit [Erythrobacter rubeus]